MAKGTAAGLHIPMPGSGGGKKKVPWWIKVPGFALLVVVAACVSVNPMHFLVLVVFGAWTAWAWHSEKGNVVDSLRDWVLMGAILVTAFGPQINDGLGAFRDTRGWDAVGAKVSDWWPDGKPEVKLPTTETTVAPPAPPAPGVGPIAQGQR